jgi:bifunctional enzyme CysN/CysC
VQEKSLLRFTTSGSVDDGKSTLIGRLLFETKTIYEDQLQAAENTSKRRGQTEVDLSLLLDGLAAEREQGITIDVAYRYFETPKRKFIIADTPGHEQYTRNMVTGASTAQLALILIDARNGVLTQSRRHGFIVSLLQIPHLVVLVNKMDLVDYRKEVFDRIVADYEDFSERLDIHDITFIPISALKGDNVVNRSPSMPWHEGPTVLSHLENIHVTADRNLVDFRFPVQYVIRPHQDFRGYAGRVASGTIREGEQIVTLPSGRTSQVKSIVTYDGGIGEAVQSQSVVITLADERDISRGDMIVRPHNLPAVANRFDATICWMDQEPLTLAKQYLLKHTTRYVKASVSRIHYRIDVNTLHRRETRMLQLNEIARVEMKTSLPLYFDPYHSNHETGSFVLVDPVTNLTAAAGMIRGEPRDIDELTHELEQSSGKRQSSNVVWQNVSIGREEHEKRNGHKAAVLWLTGYSGSGKSTIARALERELFSRGTRTMLLDGDNVRHGLCGDLGFSERDRTENIRRVGEVARLFFDNGHLVICTFISPFRRDREFVRSLLPHGRFAEVYVRCDLEICKQRDPKGLYRKALSGEIKEFTGVDSPYEEPTSPEISLATDASTVGHSVSRILEYLRETGIVD